MPLSIFGVYEAAVPLTIFDCAEPLALAGAALVTASPTSAVTNATSRAQQRAKTRRDIEFPRLVARRPLKQRPPRTPPDEHSEYFYAVAQVEHW